MALDKKESIQRAIKDSRQSGNVIWSPFKKVAAILVFPNIAVSFKLNYFKLIHLQANMLSSFIFTYFAVDRTNLPHNLSFRLKNTRFRTQSHFASSIVVLYLPDN